MPNIHNTNITRKKKNGRIWDKNILDPFAADLWGSVSRKFIFFFSEFGIHFSLIFILYWNIIDLKFCATFTCTAKRFNCTYATKSFLINAASSKIFVPLKILRTTGVWGLFQNCVICFLTVFSKHYLYCFCLNLIMPEFCKELHRHMSV